MNNLELGKKGFVWTKGSYSGKWGTIDKVTPKWIHIQGFHRTRSQWILIENITSFHLDNEPIVIISQMFDH